MKAQEKLGHLPKVTQPLRGKARTQPCLFKFALRPLISASPAHAPGSACINSLLLFILGVAHHPTAEKRVSGLP